MRIDTFGVSAPFLKAGHGNGFLWLVDGISACNADFVTRLAAEFQNACSDATPMDVVMSALDLIQPAPGEFCHFALAHVIPAGDREILAWVSKGDVRVIYGLGDHDKDQFNGELTEGRDSILLAGLENIISRYEEPLRAEFGKHYLQVQHSRGLTRASKREDLQFGRLVVHNPKSAIFAFCSTAFTTSADILKAANIAEFVYDLRRTRSLSQFFKESASTPAIDPFCDSRPRLHRGFPFEILRLTGVSL